jgi:hypothetical protein
MVFTDQIFLGHLGTEEMAAAALGNMVSVCMSARVHVSTRAALLHTYNPIAPAFHTAW